MGLTNLLKKIPVVGGAFDDSEDQAKRQLELARKQYEKIMLPGSVWDDYSPEEYAYTGDLNVEGAQAQQVSDDPLTRSAQLSALAKMAGLSETGLSAVDEAGFGRAQDLVERQARSSREAAVQNARARGVGGSGLEFAMREMGSQAAADRGRESALDVAANAAQQRALYSQAYGSQLAGMRDQDYRTQSRNADALDRFNMQHTQDRNNAAQWNLQRRDQLGQQNTGLRNQSQMYNQEGRRSNAQQRFGNEMTLARARAGGHEQAADVHWAENERNARARAALGQAAGTAIGAGFGGPAGAQMGGAIGGGIGSF